MLFDGGMGELTVERRKLAVLVSTALLFVGWYRSPQSSGSAEFASKHNKPSAAIASSKKVSATDFNAALLKASSKRKAAAEKKPKKVAVPFHDQRDVRPSTEKFFNTMRVAEGHGDLPIDPPAPTPTPLPRSPEPTRKRPTVQKAFAADPISYESEQSYQLVSRISPRVRTRSRTSPITLIPTGGVSYSQFDVTGLIAVNNAATTVDLSARAGYMTGLLLDVGHQTVSMQTGLVYIQEGLGVRMSGTDSSGLQYSGDYQMKVHYIGLPLVAKLNTGSPGETRVSMKGGVVPVYATNVDTEGSAKATYGTLTQTLSSNSSSQEDLRRFNVLGQVGAGVVLPSGGNVDFRFDVIYNRSLMTVESQSGSKMYSQSVMGVLGMGIPL